MRTDARHPDGAPGAGLSRGEIWFGLLGGILAWMAHLMLAYVIAEFGCVLAHGGSTFLGVTVVGWMLIGLSVVTLLVAVAATLVPYRGWPGGSREGEATEADDPKSNLAIAGTLMSGMSAFVILIESVPIFYYLQSC